VHSGLLREFIRCALLDEAAVAPGAAGEGGLCLIASDTGTKKTLVLFDPRIASMALEASKQSKGGTRALTHAIVGYIQLGREPEPQNGAMSVSGSAARKGHGPLMYDIAMSMFGRITADRNSVSPSAANVWSYYFSKRPDVKKLPFDDVRDPKTPPKADDAMLHAGADSPLNYSYEGAKVDTSRLLQNTERWLAESEKAGYDRDGLENVILDAGKHFFFRS
jgi:hypothetical protein